MIVALSVVWTSVLGWAFSCTAANLKANPRPVVGAIRWDAWFPGGDFQANLTDARWSSRLPFYTRMDDGKFTINSDTQEVMDKEISLAADAGLNYWAFCYYDISPSPLQRYNSGLKRYLSSQRKNALNFCIILVADHLRPKAAWHKTVQQLVAYFQEPSYQKVAGNRPLLYLFDAGCLTKWAGSDAAVRSALEELRLASLRAGLRPPYLVVQGTSATSIASIADRYGLDAVSAYTLPEKGPDAERPFKELVRANRNFWDECKVTAKQIIPIVNVGWDNRPRRTSPDRAAKLRGPWYLPPATGELGAHLHDAVEWVRRNPQSAEANAVIIYAWNEYDEGGWLVPTLAEGAARLEEVKSALQSR